MAKTNFKIGDIVWVDEPTISGKLLKHEWVGKIIELIPGGDRAFVKDIDEDSMYFNLEVPRFLSKLEKKI